MSMLRTTSLWPHLSHTAPLGLPFPAWCSHFPSHHSTARGSPPCRCQSAVPHRLSQERPGGESSRICRAPSAAVLGQCLPFPGVRGNTGACLPGMCRLTSLLLLLSSQWVSGAMSAAPGTGVGEVALEGRCPCSFHRGLQEGGTGPLPSRPCLSSWGHVVACVPGVPGTCPSPGDRTLLAPRVMGEGTTGSQAPGPAPCVPACGVKPQVAPGWLVCCRYGLSLFPECDPTCVGCTGKGPGQCKECIAGYTKESGQCAGQCTVQAGLCLDGPSQGPAAPLALKLRGANSRLKPSLQAPLLKPLENLGVPQDADTQGGDMGRPQCEPCTLTPRSSLVHPRLLSASGWHGPVAGLPPAHSPEPSGLCVSAFPPEGPNFQDSC